MLRYLLSRRPFPLDLNQLVTRRFTSMKLKPIVASMLVLVSGPVLAAASDNANTQAQLDAMKANVAKLQAIVEQNQPGGFQQPDNWWNRITLSGQAIVDGFYSSATSV